MNKSETKKMQNMHAVIYSNVVTVLEMILYSAYSQLLLYLNFFKDLIPDTQN